MVSVIDKWQSETTQARVFSVIPDGCRDLIFDVSPGHRPYWYLTDLDDCSCHVSLSAGQVLFGFRLKPGTMLNARGVLESLVTLSGDQLGVQDRIEHFSSQNSLVTDCLASLETGAGSPASAAKLLGIHPRRMQRALAATGRSPAAWHLLARARNAARAVCAGGGLADIAADYGYADQSHMSREFRRWFDETPAKLPGRADIVAQLKNPSFA